MASVTCSFHSQGIFVLLQLKAASLMSCDSSSRLPGGIISLPSAITDISLDNECVTSSMLMILQTEGICQNNCFTVSLALFFVMGLMSLYSTLVGIAVFGLIGDLITLI